MARDLRHRLCRVPVRVEPRRHTGARVPRPGESRVLARAGLRDEHRTQLRRVRRASGARPHQRGERRVRGAAGRGEDRSVVPGLGSRRRRRRRARLRMARRRNARAGVARDAARSVEGSVGRSGQPPDHVQAERERGVWAPGSRRREPRRRERRWDPRGRRQR